jgi:hypothetical protein
MSSVAPDPIRRPLLPTEAILSLVTENLNIFEQSPSSPVQNGGPLTGTFHERPRSVKSRKIS